MIQILVSTVVGAVLSAIVVVLHGHWAKDELSTSDIALIALTVGLSILLWRGAGNTSMLNEDPLLVVSPNDVLCPVLTYMCLGLLAAFRPAIGGARWPRLRALLTVLLLLVNVATI